MFNIKLILAIVLSFALLSSCKSIKNDQDDIVLPAVELYNSAKIFLNKGEYKRAAQKFADIYYQHPGSEITPYAEIMEAYSYYVDKKYEDAVDILDAFLKLHPMHEDVPYVYYLRALCLFMQMSDVYFDQSSTHNAINALNQVIEKFPGSKYVKDCQEKLLIANDYSAAQNMEIGRYYLFVKNNPIAAIERFKDVIYTTSEHVPEGLYRIYECFMLIGLVEEAKIYSAKLKQKFPNNYWTLRSSK